MLSKYLFINLLRQLLEAVKTVGEDAVELKYEWLGYVGITLNVTSDVLAHALAYALETRLGSLAKFNTILDKIREEDQKREGTAAQYTFDITRDTVFINELFSILGDKRKHKLEVVNEDYVIKKTLGEKIMKNFFGYTIYKVRESVQTLKKGTNTINL